MEKLLKRLKEKTKRFIKDERGEFGLKQIAITLGVIILVGFVVTTLKDGLLAGWIEDTWDYLFEQIQNLTS